MGRQTFIHKQRQFSAGIFILAFAVFSSCSSDPSEMGYESGEENSGGAVTTFDFGANAFSHQAPGLTFDEETWFAVGNSFFKQNWVSAPSSTAGRDGLGPLMNAFSCSGCHLHDGRGEAPSSVGPSTSALLFRLSDEGTDAFGGPMPNPVYGGQLQNMSISGVQPEGTVSISYQYITGTYDDGTSYELRKPVYQLNGNYGSLAGVLYSPRIGMQVIGLGLLEAISESDILAHTDENDADGDGVSGRANYVWDYTAQASRLGRFGWKANQPGLRQQVAGAFVGDIGITSSLFTDENCTSSQQDCNNAPNGNDAPANYELSDYQLERVTFYMAVLSVPGRRNAMDETVLQGKQLFNLIGCAGCHISSFTTGTSAISSVLSYQKIFPYSDLLLHDMGADLSDGRADYLATGNEWRTQPLWGLGLIQTVNGHTNLLHDGRARTIEEAVLWHDGEAASSKNKFKQLTASERNAVLKFLESL